MLFNLKDIAQKAEEVRRKEEEEKQRKQEETNTDILNRIEALDLTTVATEIAGCVEKYTKNKSYHCVYVDVETLNNMIVMSPVFIDETKGTENVLRFKIKIGTESGVDIAEKVSDTIFKNLNKFFEDELKQEDVRSKFSRTIWLR